MVGRSDQEVKLFVEQLLKDGIRQYNEDQCKKSTPIFQWKKQGKGDCRQCQKCGASYSKELFFRHKAKCQGDSLIVPKPFDLSLAKPSSADSAPAFLDLLSSLQNDDVGNICKQDSTIRLIGSRLFQKDRSKVDKTMEVRKSVRATMRSLAILYLELKHQMELAEKPCLSSEELFSRRNFEELAAAISIVCAKEESTGIKYGMKNNYLYVLTSSAQIIKATHLMKPGMEAEATEIGHFLDVLDLNKNYVFGDAKYHINNARQVKLRLPGRSPEQNDLAALQIYTLRRIDFLTNEFTHVGIHEYVELRNAICSRLTLFNARRGGEPSRLKIVQWTERRKWLDSKAITSLSECDKKLFSQMEVTYQTGKGNHLVPCIVPLDCVRGLEILLSAAVRREAGIINTNSYLFPNTGGSNLHVMGWDCTKFMCTAAGIQNPLINATNQRARISTLYAALDVPESDRPYFYKHMGHSEAVNAGTYQRPLAVMEVVKVGRLLQQFDTGTTFCLLIILIIAFNVSIQ